MAFDWNTYDFNCTLRYNGAVLISENHSIKALGYSDAKEVVRIRLLKEFAHLEQELMAFRFVGKLELKQK